MAEQTKTLWKIGPHTLAKHDSLRRCLRLSANIWNPRGKVVDRRGIASPGQDGIRLADQSFEGKEAALPVKFQGLKSGTG